jgi:hypothetical protein
MSWDSSKGRAFEIISKVEQVRIDDTDAGHNSGTEDEQEHIVEADKSEERALVKKLDRRILPITCILYLFACTTSTYIA